MSKELALEIRNITKRFPGVLANDSVNLKLVKGEIHALLGENGAGKSTLMNVLYGLYQPDEGEVYVDGQRVEIHDPNDAIAHGIGMVHQHFMLVPVFSVAENIMLGSEETKGMSLDIGMAREKIRSLSYEYGLQVDPDAIVEDLPVGLQQRVEIVKALYRDARILVLDEPTAVLTPQEAQDLFKVMHQLTSRGVSIIFITHKLKEVLAVANAVTVMRRGRVVDSVNPQGMNERSLAAMMVGRDVLLRVEKEPAKPGGTVLSVKNLTILDERGVPVIRNFSLDVNAGEILGIAGVQGNGQTELAEVLTGLRRATSGTITLDGQNVPLENPRYLFEHGMAHVPEDRHKHGLVLAYDLVDNIALNAYYKPPFAKGFQRDRDSALDKTVELIEQYDVRTPGPNVHASTLSGGNQQKVIIARELSRPIKLLIVNQPTRGLDVGSIEFIHRRIVEERDKGVAVLLISAELDEILGLADRIAVMFHGQIVATMPAEEATREKLGLLMAGSDEGKTSVKSG
ncbi:MAG: ABC transporter ATP-binding protein [Anaerolineales bacterium]|nr:ABC transporter ATP-binding protein [Anaerolineales bacterium]